MSVKCLSQCLAQLILEKYWLFVLPSSSSNFIQLFKALANQKEYVSKSTRIGLTPACQPAEETASDQVPIQTVHARPSVSR